MKASRCLTLAAVCAALSGLTLHAGHRVLYSFPAGEANGSRPQYSQFVRSGSTLFDMTMTGGTNNLGAIYKINMDGTGYVRLHSFAGGANGGSYPQGSLTLDGSTLYGMTNVGGEHSQGTIFKIGTDGNGFEVLHSFAEASEGGQPFGDLTLDGSTLYGATHIGGDDGVGTVFKIGTNGTGFTVLHHFVAATEGGDPLGGALTLSNDTLYGTTLTGGTGGRGTIFKMKTNGGDFAVLHSFDGSADDGSYPCNSLTLVNSTFYGTTMFGGENDAGTVFKIGTGGGDFEVIHSFSRTDAGGSWPGGALTFSDSKLYGTTSTKGSGFGTIFCVGVDGSNFTVLRSLAGQPTDAGEPLCSLLVQDGKYYGSSTSGGEANLGAVFSEGFACEGMSRVIAGGGNLVSWRTPGAEGVAQYMLERRGGNGWEPVGVLPADGGEDGTYLLVDEAGAAASRYRVTALKLNGGTLDGDEF